MARPLRPQFPGAIYHLTARGNRRQCIFLDALDAERFLAVLGDVVAQLGWRVRAYCLMPNHYHLLVETPGGDVSRGMQLLNGAYAQWFNMRHDLDGHLFQGRFKSVLVERGEHLLETVRYIVLNPVRAGLCRHPRDWRWSSYRAMLAPRSRPVWLAVKWVLAQFGRDQRAARARLAAFIRDGLRHARPASAVAVHAGKSRRE